MYDIIGQYNTATVYNFKAGKYATDPNEGED